MKTNEWIPWEGGKCPVDKETYVLIQESSGRCWADRAGQVNWNARYAGHLSQIIIAYMVIGPYKPKRWRAEKDGKYWLVSARGNAITQLDRRFDFDNETYQHGNYFRTFAQAERAAKLVGEALMKAHEEVV